MPQTSALLRPRQHYCGCRGSCADDTTRLQLKAAQRYQTWSCGEPNAVSLAIQRPPEAERSPPPAAKRLKAPAVQRFLNGDRGDGSSGWFAANCGRPVPVAA